MTIPSEPFSRKEQYLAKAAGQDVSIPAEPFSREEQYLEAIAQGGGAVESYDSTAEFPAEGEEGKIYIASDTGYMYTWDGSAYTQVGGGGETPVIKVLTSADANYPVDNPSRISLYRLPDGFYCKGDSTVVTPDDVPIVGVGDKYLDTGELVSVVHDSVKNQVQIAYSRTTGDYICLVKTTGDYAGQVNTYFVRPSSVKDSLTSNSTNVALSAKQGKVLKETIDNRIRVESTAPTTSTAGALGQLWIDNTGPTIYILSNISGSTYTWTNLMA